jgi:rubrerythrin
MSVHNNNYENNDIYSEYSSEEYGNNGENTVTDKIKNMISIEEEVWEVYKYLQKEVDNNGGVVLKNLSLNLVYELMYPDYQPLF